MIVLKPEELFERLRCGHTFLTGNSRLARVLTGQYSQWQLDRGEQQWPSANILPWGAWIDRLWEEAGLAGAPGTARAVPNNRQLLSLWESVLAGAENAAPLLRPEAMAGQTMETRRLAVEWGLDLNDAAWCGDDENANSRAFSGWNRAFEDLCRMKGWIPPEDRSAVLQQAVQQGSFRPAGPLDLLGFDELTPAQGRLIDALGDAGVDVSLCTTEPAAGHAALWSGDDPRHELTCMARWVRHWHEQEPKARIGIVVPDLQTRRDEVERALQNILTPGQRRGEHFKPWNVSLGVPLSRVPMIESAFALMSLLKKRIDIQDVGRVLRSPWIRGGTREKYSRALLEKCLRENYPRQLKPGEVLFRAGEVRKYDRDRSELPEEQWEDRPWNCPMLKSQWQALVAFERETRSARNPSAWADAFEALLSGQGWPLAPEQEGATIPAAEHDSNWQAFQAWQDSLRELASLDVTVHRLERSEAIAQLQRICRERVFQARSAPAGIQVLGLYEASGLRFDRLWVLGLHNGNWPPPARPDPFIPARLQLQAGLPHSSPQRELEVARALTQRLLDTAADTVFSYPKQIDGEDSLPSPLLLAHSLKPLEHLPGWAEDEWQLAVLKAEKPGVEPLTMPGPLQRRTARGGTSILRNQALCPFRAFASNRLGAEGLETPVDGISAMLHGSLMHRVLEEFWRETVSRENLLALNAPALVKRLESHIDRVLDDERGLRYRPEFRNVEAGRLLRLALKFLELDRQREPFRVEGFEREILHEIEGQTIRLIVDRVDRLEGGGEAIIDYKTGRVDPKKWFGERPEDPQLPLYAISAMHPPDAVVFAVVRDDECLYRGVVNRKGLFPDLPPPPRAGNEALIGAGNNLPATIAEWKSVLHGLMADFLAGEASIDPKDGLKTCDKSYCELRSLCRVDALLQSPAPETPCSRRREQGSGTPS